VVHVNDVKVRMVSLINVGVLLDHARHGPRPLPADDVIAVVPDHQHLQTVSL
jgi:hypothetical protein